MKMILRETKIIFFIFFSHSVYGIELYGTDTSSYLNTLELIKKLGYPAESHQIQTNDGYILQLHRVPHGQKSKNPTKQHPILIMHGLFGSSAIYFLRDAKDCLPLLLADEGYDVWLGNMRGNPYSKAHINLTPEDHSFWNFSFHEPGIYDLPATIDFISEYTNKEKLIYIGYSMGTTVYYVMSSERPEYQKKIKGANMLASIAYLESSTSLARVFVPFVNFLAKTNLYINEEIIEQSTFYRYLTRLSCTLFYAEKAFCRDVLFLFIGSDPEQFLVKNITQNFLFHFPQSTSVKTLLHLAEVLESGGFHQFDYGPIENKARYGSSTPPSYNLSAITTEMYLYEGQNDALSTLKDVYKFTPQVKSVKDVVIIDYPKFNHFDFLFGLDVKELLFDKLIKDINEFDNSTN